MSRAAVIGESARTAGFALAGALVFPAENADEARAAWARASARMRPDSASAWRSR